MISYQYGRIKGELLKLKNLAVNWFNWVKNHLVLLTETDRNALTAPLFIVDLLAYERNITRFIDEPESLYRKRVFYAFINANEAGTTTGLKNIFLRLGIGEVTILEQNPNYDWDVITISLLEAELAANQPLLKVLLATYGRTCRRYVFESITTININSGAGAFNQAYSVGICPKVTL